MDYNVRLAYRTLTDPQVSPKVLERSIDHIITNP